MADVSQPLSAPPAPVLDGAGLTEEEAQRRLAAGGGSEPEETGRSYASIVRANVLTVFNGILLGFGAVTLIFGDARDALFLAIIIANAAIGITQEVKAKRALERLSLLVAPQARVRRDGVDREVGVSEVVAGDLVLVQAGDQVVADGRVLSASDLRVDESILTGESEPAARGAGDELRSGAFVSEGTGAYEVTATGADSFAARLTGEARSFRHPRSALEQAINRLLYALVGLVVFLGAVLGYSLYHRHVAVHNAVATSAAGVVSLIPEGLVLLVGVTYAAAAVRMSRRGVLAQQLNAIESLASVDTICVDKTGTLTEPSLRVVEVVAADGSSEEEVEATLGAVAASASARNLTLQAIADAFPAEAEPVAGEVPFASRRRWSAVALERGSFYLGAPGRVPIGALGEVADQRQADGRRVLAVARSAAPLPSEPHDDPPEDLEPVGLVVLAEELRPGVSDTVQFLQEEGVEIKVLSGDAPATVAAIARDVGIPVAGVHEGNEIPGDPAERRVFAENASVIGRISPEGKQAIVQSLRDEGRYVAMIGDGVNDVPALKASRLAIAQGSGTQMARSVSDLVLISGDFGVVPTLVAEGRRALRNLQRVTKLYVTKSAFAAFLILTIGISSDAYPLLPRHFTLAAAHHHRDPHLLPRPGPEQRAVAARRVRARGVAVRDSGGGADRRRRGGGLPVRASRPRPVAQRRPDGGGHDPRGVRPVPRAGARVRGVATAVLAGGRDVRGAGRDLRGGDPAARGAQLLPAVQPRRRHGGDRGAVQRHRHRRPGPQRLPGARGAQRERRDGGAGAGLSVCL